MAEMDPAEIAVSLARIEAGVGAVRLELGGKLDLLNAQAVTQANTSADHEARLRAQATEIADLKARPTVTPKQLAGWLTLGLCTVSTAAPFVIFALR